MTTADTIQDRINKLLALANGNTTPGEATAARALAEKLMKKYNISPSRTHTPPPPRHYEFSRYDADFVAARLYRATDKAYLLQVFLDSSKYPWSSYPQIYVFTWIPKSQVVTNIGDIWLLNKDLLLRNMTNNIPYLITHHPVFKGLSTITFHLANVMEFN